MNFNRRYWVGMVVSSYKRRAYIFVKKNTEEDLFIIGNSSLTAPIKVFKTLLYFD